MPVHLYEKVRSKSNVGKVTLMRNNTTVTVENTTALYLNIPAEKAAFAPTPSSSCLLFHCLVLETFFLMFPLFSAGRDLGLGPDSPTPLAVLLGSVVTSAKDCFLLYCFDRLGFHRESSIFCRDTVQRWGLRSLRTWA